MVSKMWTDESRQMAANVQKEKRRNIHHDNVTKLPHMLQFLRWKTEIGYKVNDLEGRIPTKKFVKKTDIALANISLKILDQLFIQAINYIKTKPELQEEVTSSESILTAEKYDIETLKTSWPVPKSYVTPTKTRTKTAPTNPEYEIDRKVVSKLKTKRFDDHNGNKLPFGVRPILKRPDLGYAVTRHPLLKDAEFQHYDLDESLAMASSYITDYSKANFRKAPMVRYIELYKNLEVDSQMLNDFISHTKYEFLVRD